MLTLAPGGMRSSVPLWQVAAINPLTAYAGQYQMIAMDQRNVGRSAGPLEAGGPWGGYAAGQLAVTDHLGIGRFLVFGCCLGGPFVLKLLELARRSESPRPSWSSRPGSQFSRTKPPVMASPSDRHGKPRSSSRTNSGASSGRPLNATGSERPIS
jgi:pimeloyl-ACP methyl ester carboxylesterase